MNEEATYEMAVSAAQALSRARNAKEWCDDAGFKAHLCTAEGALRRVLQCVPESVARDACVEAQIDYYTVLE